MSQTFGLAGSRVRLVPYDPEKHFETTYRWFNNPDLFEYLGLEYPNTREDEREFFQRVQASKTDVYWSVETLDGLHIGATHLFGINHYDKTCSSGSFIGDVAERGHGYGTEASILRARYAFHILGMRQIYSCFLGDNARSRRMMEKTGYQHVGTYPERRWKRGKYVDEVVMMLSRERFLNLHGDGMTKET